jgi:hypothetical protein
MLSHPIRQPMFPLSLCVRATFTNAFPETPERSAFQSQARTGVDQRVVDGEAQYAAFEAVDELDGSECQNYFCAATLDRHRFDFLGET